MKKKMLQRLLAFVLAVCFLLGGAITVGATGEDKNSGSLQEFKEQLNAQTYEEYLKEYADVPRYEGEDIVINGVDYVADEKLTTAEVRPAELADGTKVLYTPNAGTVTWKVTVPTTRKYSIVIEYWPDEAKSASIERLLMIDGNVPFAEARFLTLPKVWKNEYVTAEVYVYDTRSIC